MQAISRFHLPLADRPENAVAAIYSCSHGEGYVIILGKKIGTFTWGFFFLIRNNIGITLRKVLLNEQQMSITSTITFQE